MVVNLVASSSFEVCFKCGAIYNESKMMVWHNKDTKCALPDQKLLTEQLFSMAVFEI